MDNTKIRVKFANYALFDILKALKSSDIDEVTITKEDGDLLMLVDTNLIPLPTSDKKHGCWVALNPDGMPDLAECITATGMSITSGNC